MDVRHACHITVKKNNNALLHSSVYSNSWFAIKYDKHNISKLFRLRRRHFVTRQ